MIKHCTFEMKAKIFFGFNFEKDVESFEHTSHRGVVSKRTIRQFYENIASEMF